MTAHVHMAAQLIGPAVAPGTVAHLVAHDALRTGVTLCGMDIGTQTIDPRPVLHLDPTHPQVCTPCAARALVRYGVEDIGPQELAEA